MTSYFIRKKKNGTNSKYKLDCHYKSNNVNAMRYFKVRN